MSSLHRAARMSRSPNGWRRHSVLRCCSIAELALRKVRSWLLIDQVVFDSLTFERIGGGSILVQIGDPAVGLLSVWPYLAKVAAGLGSDLRVGLKPMYVD